MGNSDAACYVTTGQKVKLFHILLIAWRFTLVVAFGPKILGGGGDLQMLQMLFYDCRLNGGDTLKPTCCN